MAKTYASDALAAIHETAEGLHALGLVPTQTMQTLDELCLTTVAPDWARGTYFGFRMDSRASQAVFARHLNVSVGLVSQWERGLKHPRGASLKLLTLVARKGLAAIA